MDVKNSKVKYIRPKYNNLLEVCEDCNNVYIGRKGIVFINNQRYPQKDSIWANPYKVGKDGTLKEILDKYEEYILEKIENENLYSELENLKNKSLYCWCTEDTNFYEDNSLNICHGQVLLKLF